MKIIVFMVLKDTTTRGELVEKVIFSASKISKNFFFVLHNCNDDTEGFLKKISEKYDLRSEMIEEKNDQTMDDMKGKYYNFLYKKYTKNDFILVLDRDEILDEKLINSIKNNNFESDIYQLRVDTFLVKKIIGKIWQPRLFRFGAIDLGSHQVFHDLFRLKSKNIKFLEGKILHYSYATIGDLFKKSQNYALGEAKSLFEKNKKITNIGLFFRFLYESNIFFFYTLIVQKNIFSFEGWIYSSNWIYYKYMKYTFYYELKNKF